MMVPPARRRDSLAPALLAAAALHVGLFMLATLIVKPSPPTIGSAVPINIVSNAPATDSRRAEAAPRAQAAQTQTPVPEARPPAPPPEVAAPAPEPTPRPARPRPKPVPAPAPRPVKPQPRPRPEPTAKPKPVTAPPKPAPARPTTPDTFSLDALEANIARSRKPSPPRPASGLRGPTRAETAPEARVDAGEGVSQSDIAGLSQLLERLWNPNCDNAERGAVVIPVKFTVSFDGHVIGRITEGGRDTSSDPVVATAARRAIDAVHQAEPYGPTYRGQTFTVNFDAKKACANH